MTRDRGAQSARVCGFFPLFRSPSRRNSPSRGSRGAQSQKAGLAFELEAGLILFRRPGLGRVWIFGFALLPTFDVVNDPIPSVGLGVRLGL